MNIESGFAQVAQSLLWPVLVLVGLAFVYALWAGGATLMEAWQRWRQPQYRSLRAAPGLDITMSGIGLGTDPTHRLECPAAPTVAP